MTSIAMKAEVRQTQGGTQAPLLPVYNRSGLTIESGAGVWLKTDDGRSLLDFSSGVAVVNLGHRHPEVLEAASAQLNRIWHTSNHFWSSPMVGLANRLSDRFGGAEVFFCNSGAEANEAVIKYARKATGRPGIVALNQSFHGRTCGALSLTGQPAKRDIFRPLLPGVSFVDANDIEGLKAAVTDQVGLVIMEAIQGEGGVRPLTREYVQAARAITRDRGALLAIDEIQCGVGRTGTFFGFETLQVRPDLVSMAKGLANGLPIGAMLVSTEACGAFGVGDHATTFGGNPVACAAACSVVDAVTDDLLENCRRQGERLRAGVKDFAKVREVRGRGLLLGCELDMSAADAVAACREHGLIATVAGANVLRLTPPLVIKNEDVETGLKILSKVLA